MGAPATPPERAPRRRGRRIALAIGVPAVALLVAAGVVGDVALLYTTSSSLGSARSPLRFADGGNYASASAEGFVTATFPNSAQSSVAVSVVAAGGAYGTYLLDVIEVVAETNTTAGWHLRLDVDRALAGTGINAAWAFDCTSDPSGVPAGGPALAQGTDAQGDPYAIFAPTCAGTQEAISLAAVATGTSLAVGGLHDGTTQLYLSFAVAVASTGATTTTPATLVLTATSP